MKKETLIKSLIALVVFMAVTAIYFYPQVFEGKGVASHDIAMWKGAAKEIIDFREEHGEEPLWTNSMFSGMPAYTISTRYDSNLIGYLKRGLGLGLPHPASTFFIAFLSFFVLMRCFKVKPLVGMVAALGFGLASFMPISIAAGHNSKVMAIALGPLLLAGVHLIYERKYLLGFALAALGISLELVAGHPQITYYYGLLILAYAIFRLVDYLKENLLPEFFKASVIALLAGALGFMPSVAQLWTTMEYSKYSTRGKSELQQTVQEGDAEDGLGRDYVFKWSQGSWENLTWMIPYFQGGASVDYVKKGSDSYQWFQQRGYPEEQILQQRLPYYWGTQPFTAGPIYMGAVICFLFFVGAFFVEGRIKWWLVAGVVLSLLLSMGKNFPLFNNLMYDYFPMYNKFRTVAMSVMIAQVSLAILAGLGLQAILHGELRKDWQNRLLIAFGCSGGLAILVLLFAQVFADFAGQGDAGMIQQAPGLVEALRADRAAMLTSSAFRSFFLILLAASALWAYLKFNMKPMVASAILAALVVFDLWGVDWSYLNQDNFKENAIDSQLNPSPADQVILKDAKGKEGTYRVFNANNPFNEANTSYYHQSIGGYSGAKIRRYQELVENQLSTGNQQVLAMLNTKYVVTPQGRLSKFPGLGNAWFVNKVEQVGSPDDELDFLGTKDFKASQVAVIDTTKFDAKPDYSLNGSENIKLLDYQPNALKYQTKNAKEGLAVFSEIYYPAGWKATIDGLPVEIKRVNYVLRALEIPEGDHTVEFKFEPRSYHLGSTISLIGSILVLGIFGLAVFMEVKKK